MPHNGSLNPHVWNGIHFYSYGVQGSIIFHELKLPSLARANFVPGLQLGNMDGIDSGRANKQNVPWRSRYMIYELNYRCRWIEDDFRPIEAKHHPVLRMMTAVANVDCNFTERSFEHRMTRIPFQIVGRFIESADPWNMIFAMFPQVFAFVWNHNSRIPNSVPMDGVSLQNRRYNNHIMRSSQFLHQRGGRSGFSIFGEFAPRMFFACAKGKWHRCKTFKILLSIRGQIEKLDKNLRHASWKQMTLTSEAAAALTISVNFA